MAGEGPLLTLSSLGKRFAHQHVLRDVTLNISSGERVLLLGANGSGKSTLLKIIAGLMLPDTGSVEVRCHGKSPTAPYANQCYAKQLGYLGHALGLYPSLTVEEHLRLVAEMQSDEAINVEASLEQWSLAGCRKSVAENLSRGQQTRLALACSILHGPKVAILDEPTNALDHDAVGELKRVLQRSDVTYLIATHDIERLRDCATRVLVLSQGTLLFDSAGSSADEAIGRYLATNR